MTSQLVPRLLPAKKLFYTIALIGERITHQLAAYVIATISIILGPLFCKPTASVILGINFRAEAYEWFGERQYLYLIFSLAETGAISCRPRDAYLLFRLLPVWLFLRSVKIFLFSQDNQLIITDWLKPPGKSRVLRIDKKYYTRSKRPDEIYMPFFAHPNFYMKALYKKARQLRHRTREIVVFFAGNITPSIYNQFSFPMLNRCQILSFVANEFNSATEDGRLKLLLTDESRDKRIKGEFVNYLTQEKYFDFLSKADFFICPPGWRIPHSHNLIEAMSVGTIPITNYHEYMQPRLTPDYNCLAFSTIDDLKIAVTKALNMQTADIQRLRSNVLRYYDKYLEPKKFGSELRRNFHRANFLVVNDESGG